MPYLTTDTFRKAKKGNLPVWALNQLAPTFIDRVDMCPEGNNSEAFIKLIKEKGGDPMSKFKDVYAALNDAAKVIVDEHIVKEKADAAKEADVAKTAAEMALTTKEAELAAEKAKKGNPFAPKDSEEATLKKALEGADPLIKVIFEKMQAQTQMAETAAKIAKEKEEDSIAKAKATEFTNLAMPEAELVAVCKSINTLDALQQASIYKALGAAAAVKDLENTAGGTVITKAVGASGATVTTGSNDNEIAWNAIMKEATAVAKSKNITKEKGINIVMMENPELYQAYLDTLE